MQTCITVSLSRLLRDWKLGERRERDEVHYDRA